MYKLNTAIATGVLAGMIALAPAGIGAAASLSGGGPAVTAPTSAWTDAQSQATRMAKSYLAYSAFSRKGLIKQLKFEGFSTSQATRAVDSLRVNWNKQAAKMAKTYLKYSAFSRSGLVRQLKFEGFTASQANYGVRAAGL